MKHTIAKSFVSTPEEMEKKLSQETLKAVDEVRLENPECRNIEVFIFSVDTCFVGLTEKGSPNICYTYILDVEDVTRNKLF